MALAVHRRGASLAGLLALAGCVAPSKPLPLTAAPVAQPIYSPLGLESVIGRTARDLETHFGKPVLDIREGEARKLQFAGRICVLDAYLYPPKRGSEPIVTYIDARQPDGRDIDRASCVAALMPPQQPSGPAAPAPSGQPQQSPGQRH